MGPTPKILPPGAPGPPTPKKVYPQFLKIFRGQGRNFDCVIRGPPRVVCGENLVTVPWPVSPEKNSKISPKIVNFSSYANFRTFKNIECMRRGPPYDTAKGHPRTLSGEIFTSKKLEIPLAPMVNRKTLERSRVTVNSSTLGVFGVGRRTVGRGPGSSSGTSGAPTTTAGSLRRRRRSAGAATKRRTTSRVTACGSLVGIWNRFPHPSNYFR